MRQIAGCFNARFGRCYQVRLIGGAQEPLYLPAAGVDRAIIRYTRDYARSALHELAHWCLAGVRRRGRVDYGYWYQPPPRSPDQQQRLRRERRSPYRRWKVCLPKPVDSRSGSVSTISPTMPMRSQPSRVLLPSGWSASESSGLPARADEIRRALTRAAECCRERAGPGSRASLMTDSIDCVVIGAGVVGLACAARLARAGRDVVVLERHELIGSETSSRNSEVIHAGIYYPKDSLKARLCVAGKRKLYDYCGRTVFRSATAAS